MAEQWYSPKKHTIWIRGVAIAAGAVLMLAACGSPTAPPVADEDLTAAEATYAEFEAMDEGSRLDELIKAAQEEGKVVAYLRGDNAAEIEAAFEKEYDVDLEIRDPGSSSVVRQQVLEEAKAGKMGADFIEAYVHEITLVYAYEEVAAKIPAFLKEGLASEEMGTEYALEAYQWPFMVAWNTNAVTGGDVPKTYEDLADPFWDGKLVMVSNYELQYKAAFDYLTTEGGLSVEEFEELFKALASKASVQDGTNAAVQLLAAGEYAGGIFISMGSVEKAGEIPVTFDPAVEPVILMPIGFGLMREAPHPAAGMLLAHWFTTEGRDFVSSEEYVSQNPDEKRLTDATKFRLKYDDLDPDLYQEWRVAYENLLTGKEDVLPEYVKG